jgi:hypothetical protein
MKKSIEKEIVQVLNNMVKAGIVLAKKLISGETYYSLSNATQVKTKPVAIACKRNQSEAARKAWVTRRKNAAIKAVRKPAACKAVKTKQKKRMCKASRSLAAYKAWDTRKSRNAIAK